MGVFSGVDWNAAANKTLDTGLDFVRYKLLGIPTTSDKSNTSATSSTYNNPMSSALPYVLGGVAVVGIVILLAKR